MSKATPYLAVGAIAGLAFFMVRSRNKRLAAEAEARAALAASSGAGQATEILTSAMDLIEPEHIDAAREWAEDRFGFGYPSPSG